ncbi:ABC transporter permease [Pseudoalteromonas sp. MMG012]|uniref:ABC transporter permease n=1 Tax=Pseudoalteromonas sp. MMG012 TaxID=2822686 RepID=UPI001B3A0027|nr:ABC transporter permease [Pseudoalteromonas sp. MMG012]MBQ4851222.1 ABC transporter permease [Pseudoalteromonas sp. MMG012]
MKNFFANFKIELIRNWLLILGISTGFSAFMLIGALYFTESNYDNWVDDKEYIYRVDNLVNHADRESIQSPSIPASALPVLLEQIDSIESGARLYSSFISYVNKDKIKTFSTHFADHEFLSLFDVPIIAGSIDNFGNQANAIIITKDLSARLFGSRNPIGQQILTDDREHLSVIAVMDNWPKQSHLDIDSIISIASPLLKNADLFLHHWGTSSSHTYIKSQFDKDTIAKLLNSTLRIHAPPQYVKPGYSAGALPMYSFVLTPLSEAHLLTYDKPINSSSDKETMLTTLLILCLMIFLVSLMNFIVLNNSILLGEISALGIKMSFGATNYDLIFEVFLRSITLALSISILAFIATLGFFPIIHQYFSFNLDLSDLLTLTLFISLTLPVVIATLSAAIFASYFLRKKPITLINSGTSKASFSRSYSVIVFIQFSISIVLVSMSFLMNAQIGFLINNKQSFDSSETYVLWERRSPEHAHALFRISDLLAEHIGSEHVAVTGFVHGDNRDSSMSVRKDFNHNSLTMEVINFGTSGLNLFNVKLIAGSWFNQNKADDIEYNKTTPIAVILNESAAKLLGYSAQNATGKYIDQLYAGNGSWRQAKVIGVVQDFNFKTMFDEIPPTVFVSDSTRVDRLVYINSGNNVDINKVLEGIWHDIYPNRVLDVETLYSYHLSLYQRVTLQTKIVTIIASLGLLLSLVGLFGVLAIYVFSSTKEYAIRIGLGASYRHLAQTIINDNIIPILLATIVSVPVTIYFSNYWLSKFTQKVDSSNVYILAGVTVCLTSFLISLTPFWRKLIKLIPSQHLKDD